MRIKEAIRIPRNNSSAHLTNILPIGRRTIERSEVLVKVESVQVVGPYRQGIGHHRTPEEIVLRVFHTDTNIVFLREFQGC
jgi:hypothetical protein